MAPSVKSRWWIFETECPDIVADGRDKLWPDRVRFSKWIIIEFVTYDPETGAKVKVESICIAYVEFHTQMRASKGSIIESFFPEARWKREPMIDRMQGLSKLPVLEKMWSAYPTIKGEFEMIYHGPYEFGTWIPIKERLMPKKWKSSMTHTRTSRQKHPNSEIKPFAAKQRVNLSRKNRPPTSMLRP